MRQRRPPPPYLSHINVETATASASGVTGKGLRSSCQGSCDEGTLCQLDLPVLEQQDNNKKARLNGSYVVGSIIPTPCRV